MADPTDKPPVDPRYTAALAGQLEYNKARYVFRAIRADGVEYILNVVAENAMQATDKAVEICTTENATYLGRVVNTRSAYARAEREVSNT